jgi:hypothetical protein
VVPTLRENAKDGPPIVLVMPGEIGFRHDNYFGWAVTRRYGLIVLKPGNF